MLLIGGNEQNMVAFHVGPLEGHPPRWWMPHLKIIIFVDTY
jgi:hypothetical protein